MRNLLLLFLINSLFFSCSFKNQLTYINNGGEDNISKINFNYKNCIEIGDVLKIDIKTAVSEVSAAYNNVNMLNSTHHACRKSFKIIKVIRDFSIMQFNNHF